MSNTTIASGNVTADKAGDLLESASATFVVAGVAIVLLLGCLFFLCTPKASARSDVEMDAVHGARRIFSDMD